MCVYMFKCVCMRDGRVRQSLSESHTNTHTHTINMHSLRAEKCLRKAVALDPLDEEAGEALSALMLVSVYVCVFV